MSDISSYNMSVLRGFEVRPCGDIFRSTTVCTSSGYSMYRVGKFELNTLCIVTDVRYTSVLMYIVTQCDDNSQCVLLLFEYFGILLNAIRLSRSRWQCCSYVVFYL